MVNPIQDRIGFFRGSPVRDKVDDLPAIIRLLRGNKKTNRMRDDTRLGLHALYALV